MHFRRRVRILMYLALAAATTGALCLGMRHPRPRVDRRPLPPAPRPASDVPPNELGRVPILEYHEIGSPEARWRRTPDHFRSDLETLYRLGFRAISMQDYITGNISLPAGASPVILTFDDADAGQFRYLEQDGRLVIDPDCAVGILEEFSRRHPDFGLKATFYVLPGAFHQTGLVERKLQHLVQAGMELGNHTWHHPMLNHLSDDAVQEELARGARMIEDAVPGYHPFSMALPYGVAPRNRALLRSGSWVGIPYDNSAVVLTDTAPARSPFSRHFDPFRLPRVEPTEDLPKEPEDRFSAQLADLMARPNRRYVSDGMPGTVTMPAALAGQVNPRRVGRRAVAITPARQPVAVANNAQEPGGGP